MTDSRTRPARDRARFEMLVMANSWFWQQMEWNAGCTMDHALKWLNERPSTQIRRFMAAVRTGDYTAVVVYEGSNHEASQAPDDFEQPVRTIHEDEVREIAAS